MASSPNVPATQQAGAVSTKKDVQQWLQSDAFKNAVGIALPKHLTPDRFVRIALNAFMRTPKLMECTQESVFKCLLDLSALGLEPDGRRAHLIPFKRKFKDDQNRWREEMQCQLIIDYKGLVELMMRGGSVSNIHADIVCENDEFEYDRGEVVKHKINFRAERGEMYAVYCRVTMRDGTSKCEALSKAEIEKVRARSKAAGDGPWITDFNEMAKKTACRRVSKWIPLSPEQRDGIEADDDQYELAKKDREAGVVDMSMFQPSADAHRGHEGANPMLAAEESLKADVEAARARLAAERAKLPVLESFPDAGDYSPGDVINVKGEMWIRSLPESTSEWEQVK